MIAGGLELGTSDLEPHDLPLDHCLPQIALLDVIPIFNMAEYNMQIHTHIHTTSTLNGFEHASNVRCNQDLYHSISGAAA